MAQVFRHELKYMMDRGAAAALKSKLSSVMELDANAGASGRYKIRSLYFDDYWNSAYSEKLAGVSRRCKYRIRTYDDSDRVINLERKLKFNEYISKQSVALTRGETQQIIDGDFDFLRDDERDFCREFYYECRSKIMRPRIILDYERVPLVCNAGDVRVTFDEDVRACSLNFDVFDKDLPTTAALEPWQLILEVKYTEFLPSFIRELLPKSKAMRTSFSKFTMCCDRVWYLSAEDIDE